MNYDYFGNTSLRVSQLLFNFETQLLIFDELFVSADESDVWSNDSELQIRYLELLKAHNLLENKSQKTQLGTKDARVKSAPLEDFNLINRKQKTITTQGRELLTLIKNQAFKKNNDFLQIDLISLFFLKSALNFSKSPNLLQRYLEIFKEFDGEISAQTFALLPLINNFKSPQEFIKVLKNGTIFSNLVDMESLNAFLKDLKKGTLRTDYFKTAKGDASAKSVVSVLKKIFLPLRKSKDKNNSKDKNLLENLLSPQCEAEFVNFKKLYLPYISRAAKKVERLNSVFDFVCSGDLMDFGARFFSLIEKAKIQKNLKDYADLNRRYLSLMGIFDFEADKVGLNLAFKMILSHSHYKKILQKIATNNVSQSILNEYFNDAEFKAAFAKWGILSPKDLVNFKQNKDKERLKMLIDSRFSRGEVAELLGLFEDRKNDSEIFAKTTTEATIPTIFEYVVALAWYYIDSENLDRILHAGLSLDSNLLPKSHAVGGEADFVFDYKTHVLMIEVTLTEKTNQRRAEMESVSRHLGNLLLNLKGEKQGKSFGIFIAPYLDKNVLNDFRSRIFCYFENEQNHIRGMKILPLNTQDVVKILHSERSYDSLVPHFEALFESQNEWGSRWYENEIAPFVKSLVNGDV